MTLQFANEPKQCFTVLKEVAIDIASGSVSGDLLKKPEDSEGVEEVVVKAGAQFSSLLAFFTENRSSNRGEESCFVMEEVSKPAG